MEKRQLGKSGIAVSVVGLGCNNFGAMKVDASRKVVDKAIELGVTLFDTADVYGNRGGSESQLGEILGPRRKDIVLATKFAMPMDDAGSKSGDKGNERASGLGRQHAGNRRTRGTAGKGGD